eukprot:SAG31_NODE_19559_length_598_cov_1.723447_1_plen_54_part_00
MEQERPVSTCMGTAVPVAVTTAYGRVQRGTPVNLSIHTVSKFNLALEVGSATG